MRWILTLALLCSMAQATTYYVDNCSTGGNDSNIGTDPSTAWLTVAHVNAAALVAGDTVLFHKDCRWINDPLIPAVSGSAGNPITYDSYGAGKNKPALTNATLITTSWIADTGGFTWSSVWEAVAQQGGTWSFTNTGPGSTQNRRVAVLGAKITGTNTTIRLRLKPQAVVPYVLDDVAIGPAGTKPSYTTTGTRVTFNGGQTGVFVPAATEVVSDAITFNFNSGTDYVVALWWNNHTQYIEFLAASANTYSKNGGSDGTTTQNVSGYSGNQVFVDLEDIETASTRSPVANVYQASLVGTPSNVFRNYVKGTQQTSWASMNCEGCWLYNGSAQTLYWYTTTPITGADLMRAVTGHAPNMIAIGGNSYLTFKNLEVSSATGTGASPIDPGGSTPSNHIVYSGMDFLLNGSCGLYFQYCENNSSVSNSRMLYNGVNATGDRDGIAVGGHGKGRCIVHDIVVDANEIAYSTNANIAVSVDDTGQSPNNLTYTHNDVHHGLASPYEDAVAIDGLVTGLVFAYNLVHDNQMRGMNLIANSYGTPNGVVYNNVFANNGLANSGGRTDGLRIDEVTGMIVKNNIFCNNVGLELNYQGSGNVTADYNLYYHASGGNFMSNKNIRTTFARWQSASGQDAHGLSSDPKLIGCTTGDLRLLPGSPAIDAGVNLGTSYQWALNPDIPHWFPGEVNQDSYGAGWEIGAYAFDPRETLNKPVSWR